jgi:hypothetical protein
MVPEKGGGGGPDTRGGGRGCKAAL